MAGTAEVGDVGWIADAREGMMVAAGIVAVVAVSAPAGAAMLGG